MILYLPEIYPDELAYSWFCRYYVHSGHLTHKTALQEILSNRHDNPSKEFLGHLNPEILTVIKRMYPINNVILEHTMFPQYARFIPKEEKKKALFNIGNVFCDVHHLFSVPTRSESDLFLKYCPICAREDREKYGETYWHRTHQIRNMQVCPKHNCNLIKSTVTAKSEQTYTLCSAEKNVLIDEVKMETNSQKIKYSKYIADVFYSLIDFEKDVPISAVLYNAMENTKYLKSTGKTRNTKQLSEDIKAFYDKLEIENISSFYQIQRVLLGDRFDFSVVCQIAFYLGVDVNELTNSTLKIKQIQMEQNTHFMKDKSNVDWNACDKEIAPILEKILKDIYDGKTNEKGRPERISERTVYKVMGFPQHRLEILPKCKAVFDRYFETYEENWARRIIWAYNKLKTERESFYWSDIRKLSGVKKENIERIIPFIGKYENEKNMDAIVKLICEL